MNQLLPLDALQISAAEDQQNSRQTQDTKNLQNAFSSDGETADLTNISEAVVGVINMQEQSLWTPEKEAGSGSGIIYKKSGNKAYVVTNNHVVDQAKQDRKSTRLNSSHVSISYAVFCLKKKKQ